MIDSLWPSPSQSSSTHLTQQVFAFDLDGLLSRLKIYIMLDTLFRLSPVSQWISRREKLIVSALDAARLGNFKP